MALTIAQAVWLVGVHSIIHGIMGIFIIMTSFYVNYHPGIINAFVAANVILIILGFCIFCVVVFRNAIVSRVFGVILAIAVIFYLISGIIYFAEFVPFFANSVFDAYLFHTRDDCWAGPERGLTVWHVLTILLLLVVFVWFYYAYLFFKLATEAALGPCAPPPPPKRRRVEQYIDEVSCQGGQLRRKERWLTKIRPGCPPPQQPPCPPPCLPLCPPSCPPLDPTCPPPCPRPCPKQGRKSALLLMLKPTRFSS